MSVFIAARSKLRGVGEDVSRFQALYLQEPPSP